MTPRERVRSPQLALRSDGAAERRPNDFVEIGRAAARRTIPSRLLSRGARGAASEAFQGKTGPADKRR